MEEFLDGAPPAVQLDRFLLHLLVNYPYAAGERAILEFNRAEQKRAATDEELFTAPELVTQKEVLAARLQVLDQHLSEPARALMRGSRAATT